MLFFVIIFCLLAAIASSFLLIENTLPIVILNSVFSLFLAVTYSIFNAPDVALTEAVLNAFLASAVLFIVLRDGEFYKKKSIKIEIFTLKNLAFFIVFIVLFLIIFSVIANFNFFETTGLNFANQASVNNLYTKNSLIKTGVENVVTVALASYRGLDTMFETFVIFITSFCIAFGALKSLQLKKKHNKTLQ